MAKRESMSVGKIAIEGAKNQNGIVVLVEDFDGNAIIARGTSVPNAVTGYAKGCLFIKTDAVNGTKALYENKGLSSSCAFDVIGDIGAAEISLTDGKVLIGNGSNVAAAVTISGDITITNAGVAAIGAKKVVATMVALADGKILVGGADGASAEQTMSGDATMSNAGALTIANAAVTKSKIGYTAVAVTVALGAATGSSAADAALVGGEILGIYPTGNQDQLVDNVVLNGDGSVTVTLAANATADNTFKVVTLKP